MVKGGIEVNMEAGEVYSLGWMHIYVVLTLPFWYKVVAQLLVLDWKRVSKYHVKRTPITNSLESLQSG